MKDRNHSLVFKNVSKILNGKFLMMLPFFIIALLLIIIPLIIVVIYAFIPHYGLPEAANWEVINLTTWQIIGWTLLTSFLTTLICIVIGFPFAYLLSINKKKVFKVFALLVITSPIWSSTLFKLIGLQTMFDILNGAINSTYGDQYTILGYVYIYLPLMILPIYQVLDIMPQNYSLASKDLGASKIKTFFSVTLPYVKNGLISGISLVFIPSMMIISVTAYMNNAANSQLLGGEIYSQGSLGLDNKLSLSRASVISIVAAMILLVLWFIIVKFPKWIKTFYQYIQTKRVDNDYYKYSYNLESKKTKKYAINTKLKNLNINYSFLNSTFDFREIKAICIVDINSDNVEKIIDDQENNKIFEIIPDILNTNDIAIKE